MLSSHLLADVEDICDRIAILYRGQIRAEGAMDKLLQDTKQYRFFLDSTSPEQIAQLKEQLNKIPGLRFEMAHPRRSLEQFFVDVVKEAQQDSIR